MSVTQDICYQNPVIIKKTVTADKVDTTGYQEIASGNATVFEGATALGLGTQTDYSLRVTVDGTLRTLSSLSFGASTTWTQLAAAVQAAIRALTSKTEVVAITADGKLRITSSINGASSKISIADGVAGTPLLATITALTTYGTLAIQAAVDGVDGTTYVQVAPDAPTTKDFVFVAFVRNSSGKKKSGIVFVYSKTTGRLTVSDDAEIADLETDDVIDVVGSFV